MKYSEDIVKRNIQMMKDVITVTELASDAPVGQLLNMLDVIVSEIMEHETVTQSEEELAGLILFRISDQLT